MTLVGDVFTGDCTETIVVIVVVVVVVVVVAIFKEGRLLCFVTRGELWRSTRESVLVMANMLLELSVEDWLSRESKLSSFGDGKPWDTLCRDHSIDTLSPASGDTVLEGSMRATSDRGSVRLSTFSFTPFQSNWASSKDLECESTLSSSDIVGRDEFKDGVEESRDEESDIDEAEERCGVM